MGEREMSQNKSLQSKMPLAMGLAFVAFTTQFKRSVETCELNSAKGKDSCFGRTVRLRKIDARRFIATLS